MATLKEQLAQARNDVERFRGLLAGADNYAAANNLTTKTDAQIKYQTALDEAQAKVNTIQSQISSKKKKKAIQDAAKTGDYSKTDLGLPFETDNDLLNEIKNAGFQITPETFQMGGAGAGLFVFQGTTKETKRIPKGRQITIDKPNVKLASDVINSFWEDKAIQDKVINSMVAAGNPNPNVLEAFATWQSVVQQSANLYAAGRGPKFTPIDILNMSMTKSGGSTSVSVTKYGKEQIDSWVDNWLTEEAGMGIGAITPEQAKYIRKAVRDYASKGSISQVTRDAQGRSVTTTTPISEAGIREAIKKAASELFPKEIERNKVFEFNNILSQTLGTGSI